ncbi:MAG: hypothetical protein WA825_19455 [Steroidobacteraceae bacterium]
MKPAFLGMLLGCLAISCLSGRAVADEVPMPAPSVAAVKACIKQMDIGDKWTFTWKLVEIGAPRHPRNSYEALYAPAGQGRDNAYGYPVHVMYSVNGLKDIDAVYWLIRDTRGHWQIPAICTIQ